MAIKSLKRNTNKEKIDVKKKTKKEPNWILRITIIVLLVPILAIIFVLLTSIETKGEPVFGGRFDEQLKNKITDTQLKEVKNILVYAGVESVSVNLKSATLRVNINAADTIDRASLEAIAADAYAKVISILPVDQYFTNIVEGEKTIKMYDVEVSAYNFIPTDVNQVGQLSILISKNAPSENVNITWLSDVKNEEVRKSVENITE